MRHNPFDPGAKFYGESARVKAKEHGFYVAFEKDLTFAYAYQKWSTSPFGNFEDWWRVAFTGKKLGMSLPPGSPPHALDLPVIVALDVSKAPKPVADIDARRAAAAVYKARNDIDWSDPRSFFEERVDSGESADNALFSWCSATTWAWRTARLEGLSSEEVDLLFALGKRLAKSEGAKLSPEEDAFLVGVFLQAAYMTVLPDSMLLSVEVVPPHFPLVVDVMEKTKYPWQLTKEQVSKLRKAGWQVALFDKPPPTKTVEVWSRPYTPGKAISFGAFKVPPVAYHGTNLSSLLLAVPWLAEALPEKLPKPQDGGLSRLLERMSSTRPDRKARKFL